MSEAAPSAFDPRQDPVVQAVGKYWWVFLIEGLLALAAGWLVLVYPGRTLLLLGLAFGIYLLFVGLIRLFQGFTTHGISGGVRALVLLIGAVAVIAGIVVITRPGTGLWAITLGFGIYLLFAGAVALWRASEEAEHRGLNIALGILDLIAGLIVLIYPGIGLTTLAIVLAIYLIFAGTLAIVASFQLRKAGQAGEAAAA